MSSDERLAPPARALARDVATAFAVPGRWVSSAPWGSGHINQTLLVVFEQDGRMQRYIQQRINPLVFPDPTKVMENLERVTAHQRAVLAGEGVRDLERRALELVPTRSGALSFVDAEGAHWRTYRFIEGASSHDVVRTPKDAAVAAEAFGRFQAQLTGLPGPRLHETIPRFHDGRARLEALIAAARTDPCRRLPGCRAELEFVLAREAMVDRLPSLKASGALPERITHNDTKFNNVLLDDRTGEAVCVIDLDTVMPGLVHYDFGDLARTATCAAAEDERDLSRVRADPALFAALCEGYLRGAASFLTPAECAELAFSARLLPLVIGLRFLTDHLTGDRYFKIHRESHNLDRCRTQLSLLASMEEQRGLMEELAARAAERFSPRSGED
ncbi:MAG TPA: mucin desulfatase [Deltaproteobacteria bacterium]|nr:mucin desulfatase [Deltaproteobacteria bacterium]